MSAVIKTIADAVVAALQAGVTASAFAPQTFTPERKVLFDLKLVDGGLKVWVGGTAEATSMIARDTDQHEYTIECGVLKRVSRETLVAEVDALTLLVEQIRDYLRNYDFGDWEILRSEVAPLYDHERLLSKSQFVGVVRTTFAGDFARAQGGGG